MSNWDNEPHIIQGFGPDKQYYLFSYEVEVGVGDENVGLFDSNIRRLVIRSKGDSETPAYFDNGWVKEPKTNIDKWMLRTALRSLKVFNKKAKEYCRYEHS